MKSFAEYQNLGSVDTIVRAVVKDRDAEWLARDERMREAMTKAVQDAYQLGLGRKAPAPREAAASPIEITVNAGSGRKVIRRDESGRIAEVVDEPPDERP